MSVAQSVAVLTGTYLIGVLISRVTNGRIPSALVTIPVMFALFWSGFLTVDDIQTSGFGSIFNILNALVLVNVGTTFELKSLKKEWKLVILCLGALAGCAALVFTVGRMLWGRDMVVASYPVLAGGTIATMLMQNACIEKGMAELAAVIVLVGTVQGWLSMPVISNMVRLEGNKMLKGYRENGAQSTVVKAGAAEGEAAPGKVKLFDQIPVKYDTPYMHLFVCAAWACLAELIARYTAPMTRNIVGPALVGIFVGVAARELGLVSKDPLTKAHCMPLFMLALIMWMRRSLASLTPAALLSALGPIAGIVLLGAAGLCAVGILVGKLTGLSIPMSVVVAIQAYSGYPSNYQISTETIESLTSDPKEQEFLKDNIVSKIVIGGVVSVSVSSVIIAAIFVTLL